MRTQIPYNCSIDTLVLIATEHKKRREEEALKRFSLEEILMDVCEALNEPIERVKSKCRKTELVMCRAIFYYVAKAKTAATLTILAQFVGGRDHTTVIHALQNVKDNIDTKDKVFKDYWDMYLGASKLFNHNDFK